MLSKLLIKKFIKNSENIDDENVRGKYGFLAGIVGILFNLLLFAVKLTVGLVVNSIAATADAFNNLSDAASSVITIVSFNIASRPADEEHPFGHGRIEYIAAMMVSFMVMLVGFQFTKSSIERIIHPVAIHFQAVPFILIFLSIIVKLWLSKFNKYIGNAIDSDTLKASSLDALSDVITSICILISFLAAKFTSFPLDGYMGIFVALFILYSGFSLVKETLSPILGEAPDPKLVNGLATDILKYDYITGVHDLIVHNYGPGRCMASLHAEVPSDISIVKIHEVIDKAERELSKRYKVFLVIHMDPINTDNKEVASLKNEVIKITEKFPLISSIHDFRVVGDDEYKNLIFDIVIDFKHKINSSEEEKLIESINKEIKLLHPNFNAVITIDRDYTGGKINEIE